MSCGEITLEVHQPSRMEEKRLDLGSSLPKKPPKQDGAYACKMKKGEKM